MLPKSLGVGELQRVHVFSGHQLHGAVTAHGVHPCSMGFSPPGAKTAESRGSKYSAGQGLLSFCGIIITGIYRGGGTVGASQGLSKPLVLQAAGTATSHIHPPQAENTEKRHSSYSHGAQSYWDNRESHIKVI